MSEYSRKKRNEDVVTTSFPAAQSWSGSWGHFLALVCLIRKILFIFLTCERKLFLTREQKGRKEVQRSQSTVLSSYSLLVCYPICRSVRKAPFVLWTAGVDPRQISTFSFAINHITYVSFYLVLKRTFLKSSFLRHSFIRDILYILM